MAGSVDYSSDDKIIRMPDLVYTPDPRGLGFVLYSSMKKFENNIAQIDGITGEKDSYKSLLQRCTRVAIKLRSMGITNNDIITMCTLNHLNSFVPYLATLCIGAKINVLNSTWSVEDTTRLLNHVTPKIIFVCTKNLNHIETVIEKTEKNIKIVVFGRSDKHMSIDEFLKPNRDENYFKPYEVQNLEETCIIFYTSGTSGLPKGICTNHYSFLSQLANTNNFGISDEILVAFSSLYWITASFYACRAIIQGKTRLFIPEFDAKVLWNAIDKFKPTFMFAVPVQYMLLFQAKPPNVETSSLVHVIIGGLPHSESQIKIIQEMFPSSAIVAAYGQSEIPFFITIFKPSDRQDCKLAKLKPTSCGTGIPGIWYKIVDVNTEKLLGPNQPGELRLKTKFHLSGYFNMDSSHLWDKDGWYKTGDFVYYDKDKCFYVIDRINEFLKFRALYISPGWLESIIATHPNVASSVIIGMPHNVDENHLMALVVLKNKDTKVTEKELETFVEERVDDAKRLRGGVKIVDAIPMEPTGKIKRRDIRKMVLRGEL